MIEIVHQTLTGMLICFDTDEERPAAEQML